MDFGKRLRSLRKAAGMTQVELAKKAHVTQATISELERGESRASHSETLMALSRALDCNPEWLVSGKGSPISPIQNQNPEQAELAAIYQALPPQLRDAMLTTARSLLKAAELEPSKLNPFPKSLTP